MKILKYLFFIMVISIVAIGKEPIETKYKIENYKVEERYTRDNTIEYNIKYQGDLPESLAYVLVRSKRINLRKEPTTKSSVIGKASYGERLEAIEKVKNRGGETWYKVDRDGKTYFVYSKIVRLRRFRFSLMEERIGKLEKFIDDNISNGKNIASVNAYIPNPKVEDYKRERDKYGNVADQSAIARYKKESVYIPDRTIVAIESRSETSLRVSKLGGDEPYLELARTSVSKNPKIDSMPKKVIVIDIRNQNFGVYEKEDSRWKVVSYSYSKTGRISGLGFETPKGYFIVPAVKKKMIYTDSDGEKQGYADNAIRFSGGGYIHGTPFNYDELEEYDRIKVVKESRLGTYSGTRKCVRNSVEHSKFLFDWVVGDNIRKGNLQKPKENVVVIVI